MKWNGVNSMRASKPRNPVIFATAKTQLDDKVTGFEVGADDYLTKPTHPTELQAHVKALLARAAPRENSGGATIGAFGASETTGGNFPLWSLT